MVVPSVRVIVQDNYGCGAPERALLKSVDRIDQEGLLIKRVGVASMTVLVGRRLEIAHSRHVPSIHCCPEVAEVVLMIGLIRLANLGDRAGRQVVWVRCRSIVLERFVVWYVVRYSGSRNVLVVCTADCWRTCASRRGWTEAALEPAPGDTFCIEQVTHVLAAHTDSIVK